MKAKTLLTLAVGIASLSVSSCLHADQNDQQRMYPSASSQSQTMDTRKITPEAGPKTIWPVDPFVTADFIYWTPRQEGLAYAIEGADISLLSFDTAPGRIHEPDWDFDPGFKVGAGLRMQHDGWDVYTQYTWLHSSASDSLTNPNGILPTLPEFLFILLNILPNPPIATALDRASTSWDIHFNAIDLELGRDYYISQFLTLRPHVGLKGSWQHQEQKNRYHLDDGTNFSTKYDQDSWGIGIRAGLNTFWQFFRSFGLYGDFALSGLWSGFNNSRKDNRNNPDGTTQNFFNSGEVIHSVKPVLEFGLGLRYELLFNDDDFRFLIQAGWEEQIWMDQNHMVDLAEYGDKGSLILQGFTLEVRFDF